MVSVPHCHSYVSNSLRMNNVDITHCSHLIVNLEVIDPCTSQHFKLEIFSDWQM